MDNELWSIFSETGDPVCYLLYKASGKKEKRPEKSSGKPEKPSGGNTASM